jgi:hypothetical protein
MLQKGTDDPVVAKNWHQHNIVVEFATTITRFEDIIGELQIASCDTDSMEAELADMKRVHDEFLNKWPAPIVTKIKDTFAKKQALPAGWEKIPSQEARPAIPLLCIYENAGAAYLYYQDEQTGEYYKVPNIWYNRPNQCESKEYSY